MRKSIIALLICSFMLLSDKNVFANSSINFILDTVEIGNNGIVYTYVSTCEHNVITDKLVLDLLNGETRIFNGNNCNSKIITTVQIMKAKFYLSENLLVTFLFPVYCSNCGLPDISSYHLYLPVVQN